MNVQKRSLEKEQMVGRPKRQCIVRRDCEEIFNDNVTENHGYDDYFDGRNHVPKKGDEEWSLDYMRGLFDGNNGYFCKNNTAVIDFKDTELAINFMKKIGVQCTCDSVATILDGKSEFTMKVCFKGHNMVDFLGKIYTSDEMVCDENKYIKYKSMIGPCGILRVRRNSENAVMPSKPNASDIGFDLTVIEKVKEVGDVVFYDTGLSIEPSFGYYYLIYPRSSISKTGYMLANGVGVIDSSYRGPLLIALRKMDKDVPDLELPCRIAQLVPQRCIYPDVFEVDTLDETQRGDGGFGSSN